MGARLNPDKITKIKTLTYEGYSQSEIARRLSIHVNTVQRYTSGEKRKHRTLLGPEATRALEDFGYFRHRYFGRVTTPWQELAGNKLAELLDSEAEEYLVLNCPPGSGKALALDTPILTSNGWSTMKDLAVGDHVYSPDGQPIRVIAKSEVFYDHDCYEVRTDDGASVTADADHLWTVRLHGHGQYSGEAKPHYAGKTGPKPSLDGRQTHTTEFLARKRSKRPQLQVAEPVRHPHRDDLPIEPYVLGAWLGDGTSAGATFTSHPDDAPFMVSQFENAGYVVSHRGRMRYSVTGSQLWARDGLHTHLRLANLLDNKHIPQTYFQASVAQRLALLQGLIDTDGHVAASGMIEFSSTKRVLAEGVQYLVRSLGAKATLSTGRAQVNGKDCGEKYRVTFFLADAARLPRKAARCRNGVRTPHRYLTVTPVNSVPTQCIQVDAPDGLYLAGTGLLVTHNSTMLTDACTWVLCRERATRILYGSRTEAQASMYTRRIRGSLDRTDPAVAKARDIQRGLAHDATGILQRDYGRFKPAQADLWRHGKFVIAQPGENVADDKEASVAAFGMDSGFLGGRYDLSVWDDLVDSKNLRTAEARERMINFWENEAETRVEPGGLVTLIGQRLSADDLYRYALDLLGDDGEWSLLEDHIGGDPGGDRAGKKYHHILYPAHDDLHCQGDPGHKLTSKAWPDGCLLDPKRLSWKKLAPLRTHKAQRFNVIYQQQDIDPTSALVQRAWIDGGRGANGEVFPGCKDTDRGLLQLPEGLIGKVWTYVTADPSPSKYWSIQLWAYHPSSEQRFLLNHVRQAMEAPEFLEYNLNQQKHTGLLDAWWHDTVRIGRTLSHVFVEQNAAQKFLLQYDFVHKWMGLREVKIIGHDTHRNKTDPDYGIQMLAPLYEYGKVRLPYKGGEAQHASMKLIDEVTKYPFGHTTDCVMAQWFGEYNLPRFFRSEAKIYNLPTPATVQRNAHRGLGRLA